MLTNSMLAWFLVITFSDTGATQAYTFGANAQSQHSCIAAIRATKQLYEALKQPTVIECKLLDKHSMIPANESP